MLFAFFLYLCYNTFFVPNFKILSKIFDRQTAFDPIRVRFFSIRGTKAQKMNFLNIFVTLKNYILKITYLNIFEDVLHNLIKCV